MYTEYVRNDIVRLAYLHSISISNTSDSPHCTFPWKSSLVSFETVELHH